MFMIENGTVVAGGGGGGHKILDQVAAWVMFPGFS